MRVDLLHYSPFQLKKGKERNRLAIWLSSLLTKMDAPFHPNPAEVFGAIHDIGHAHVFPLTFLKII